MRAIVIGCGVNGAAAAARLAQRGRSVLVLESRPVIGGACNTEETSLGGKRFLRSGGAYVVSLPSQEFIEEFQLRDILIPRVPVSSITPFPDGRRPLLMGSGVNNLEEIARFSRRDAEMYPKYDAFLGKIARIVRLMFRYGISDMLDLKNPFEFFKKLTKINSPLREIALELMKLTSEEREHLWRLMTGSVTDFIDYFFENEVVKTAFAIDGATGSTQFLDEPGTAYVLLHHSFGNMLGKTGVWTYVRGGMGTFPESIIRQARGDLEVRTETRVKRVNVEDGVVRGVTLEDGSDIEADVVISNAHPFTTFQDMIGEEHLPDHLRTKLRNWKTEGASAKINLILDGLPQFRGVESSMLTGSIHIPPDLETRRRAHEAYKRGELPDQPTIEITIPSVLDPTLAPEGMHIMNIFAQWVPYRENIRGTTELGRQFWRNVLETLEPYIVGGLEQHVVDYELLTPFDLDKKYGLRGGSIFHGEMTLDQLGPGRFKRSYPEIKGLRLAGSAGPEGGGVHCEGGLNAVKDL